MTSFDKVIRSQGFWLAAVLVLGLLWLLTMTSQFFSTPAKAEVANSVPTVTVPAVGEVAAAPVGITPTHTVTPTLVALVPTATSTVEPTRTRFPTAMPTDTPEPTRTPFPTAVPTNTPVPPTRTPFPTVVPSTPTVAPAVVATSFPAPLVQSPTAVVSGLVSTVAVLDLETATPDPRLGTPDDQALFIEQVGDCWISQYAVADWTYGGAGAWVWQCTDVYLVPGTKITHVKTRDNRLKYTGKLVPFASSQYYEVVSMTGKTFWLLKY